MQKYPAQQLRTEESNWLTWYQVDLSDTRERILYAAFKETHENGFQAASIQKIINLAGVTKGALYHYFPSKHAIGEALLDEIYAEYIDKSFIEPLANTKDPIGALLTSLLATKNRMTDDDVRLGCPFDSFAQEMSPLDTDFRKHIDALRNRKHTAMAEAFKRGQAAGTVSQSVDTEDLSMLVSATLHGIMGLAKSAGNVNALMQYGSPLINYLQQLRLNPLPLPENKLT